MVKIFTLKYENGVACESNIALVKIIVLAVATKTETNLHHKPSHFWSTGTGVKEYLPE